MGWSAAVVRTLADLVLPGDCAGCGSPDARRGICGACTAALSVGARAVRPRGAPPDLPPCLSAAAYEGPARNLILGYKERGLRTLAEPLGLALARVVADGLSGVRPGWPLVLVPVPASAAAVRDRHGDHMRALARRAAAKLVDDGWVVEVHPVLRALPKADSAHMDRQSRAEAARSAFVLRPARVVRTRLAARGGIVVAVDDVLTTGATLAAVARQLATAGAPVAFAATLTATRLRGDGMIAPNVPARSGDGGDWTLATS